MNRDYYPTDLTDMEWAILQPLIPPPKSGGRPREVDIRAILDAACYVHRCGGGWRQLPLGFPPWQTVYGYVREWKRDGTWARMQHALREVANRGEGCDLLRSVALDDGQAAELREYPLGDGRSWPMAQEPQLGTEKAAST